eukprot:16452385-Heterocapsa_arctica.AAC.2
MRGPASSRGRCPLNLPSAERTELPEEASASAAPEYGRKPGQDADDAEPEGATSVDPAAGVDGVDKTAACRTAPVPS